MSNNYMQKLPVSFFTKQLPREIINKGASQVLFLEDKEMSQFNIFLNTLNVKLKSIMMIDSRYFVVVVKFLSFIDNREVLSK